MKKCSLCGEKALEGIEICPECLKRAAVAPKQIKRLRTAHSTTGGRRHTPRTARVRRYCKPSERREGAVTPNAS